MKLKLPNWGSLCNPNLLMNCDYRSGIINQKGETSYAYVDKALLTIDGWISYGVNVGLDADSIRIINRQTSDRTLRQYVEGKSGTYTVYVNVKSITGNVYVNFNQDISKNKKLVKGKNIFQITLSSSENLSSFTLLLEANADIYIHCMKLEPGEHFTGMPCWNYAMELLKCQNKFEVKSISCFAIGGTFQQFHATESASYFFCGDYTWIEKDKIPTVEVKEISTNEGVISDVSVAAISITKNGCSGFRSNIPIGRPYLLLKCWIDAYNYD